MAGQDRQGQGNIYRRTLVPCAHEPGDLRFWFTLVHPSLRLLPPLHDASTPNGVQSVDGVGDFHPPRLIALPVILNLCSVFSRARCVERPWRDTQAESATTRRAAGFLCGVA